MKQGNSKDTEWILMITNEQMRENLISRQALNLPVKEHWGWAKMDRMMALGQMDPNAEYTGDEEYVELTPEQEEWAHDLLSGY